MWPMQKGPTTLQRHGFRCSSLMIPGMTYSFTRPHPLRGSEFSIGFQHCIDAAKQPRRRFSSTREVAERNPGSAEPPAKAAPALRAARPALHARYKESGEETM